MAYLEMRGVTKRFGSVLANDAVDLSVEKGEVHALLGENGAGKSTLMNVLYGMYDHFSGEIFLDGKPLSIRSPKDAIAAGVGMVHQHFMLINAHTVVENVILGYPGNRALLNEKAAADRIRELAKRLAIDIDPYAKVGDLTVGQQQRVEIIKALFRDVQVLILDEPTAVLTPGEVESLFSLLRKLSADGMTIVLISHKLAEIMDICTACTILRQGRVVQNVRLSEVTDRYELAARMVDRELTRSIEKSPCHPGEAVLTVDDLCDTGANGALAVDHVSFCLHAGEIIGVCGVDGNGQSELIRCVTGLEKPDAGTVTFLGEDVTGKGARELLQRGMAHIPEDRLKMAVLRELSVSENLILMNYRQKAFSRHGWLKKRAIAQANRTLCAAYDVKTPDIHELLGNLSGGNQQKVVVGRELSRKPKLLIAMHPDRGLDVGATQYIQREILKARDAGAAVLLVSTELEEILEMSDTILVMYKGRILGRMPAEQATVEKLGRLMAGMA